MKKVILTFITLLIYSNFTQANTNQIINVGGEKREGAVAKLTFSGDSVLISYLEGDEELVDMSLLTIEFTYDATPSVDNLPIIELSKGSENTTKKSKEIYDLSGKHIKVGRSKLQKGMYLLNGNKTIIGN